MPERRKKVTLRDIARESRVSSSTVSLILNDRPGFSQETREIVFEAARRLGYEIQTQQPGVSLPTRLRTLGIMLRHSVGDILPPSSNIFLSNILAGILTACRQENISVLYSALSVDENNHPLEIPTLVSDPQVDGLLFVANYINEALHQAIKKRGIPVVLADSYACSYVYDMVNIDNTAGAYDAVSYLIEKGHRHIAFLGGFPDPETRISFSYRRMGYQQALLDHGIEPAYYGDCPVNNREAIIAITNRLLTENPQVTAIFSCNDEVATIAMHGVLAAGKRIPDDVSMIGFDNNTNAENTIPPLTTMNVDKVSIGRLAVQMILNRAAYPEQGYVCISMHPNLIERESVKDIRPARDDFLSGRGI